MPRTLVIGDIHGAYRALTQVLERVGPKADDTYIFLGDYVDAWSQSPEVINFLLDFKKSHACIFIRGNHDQLLSDYFEFDKAHPKWLKHGGSQTVAAYQKPVFQKDKERHLEFLKSLVNYHLDSENRLFIHAGFTNLKGIKQEWFEKMFYWDRTLWELAAVTPKDLAVKSINYPSRLKLYKEVYIGHTPTLKLGSDKPLVKHRIHNIDTGGGFNKGKITVYDIDSKQYWQSDTAGSLYPEEQGREL